MAKHGTHGFNRTNQDNRAQAMTKQDKVRWLKIADMCDRYANVSPQTIRNWVRAHVLPQPVAMGAIWLWSEAECNEADQRNREATGARARLYVENRRKGHEAATRARHEQRERERADRLPVQAVTLTAAGEPPGLVPEAIPPQAAAELSLPVAKPEVAPRKRPHRKRVTAMEEQH